MQQMCTRVCFPCREALAASWNQRIAPSAKADGADALFYAAEAARESIVLLKNNGVLPLARDDNICIVGERAKRPLFCASQEEGVRLSSPYEEMCELAGRQLPYAQTQAQTTACAQGCSAAVVFLAAEGSGYRDADLRLLGTLHAAGVRTVAVAQGDGRAGMPFFGECCAVLQTFLAGSGGGIAVAEILYGLTNPSGLLVPRAEDLSGSGLSYTEFSCKVQQAWEREGTLEVAAAVQNCGARDGKAVVRVYCGDGSGPARLVWFEKVFLRRGEEKQLHIGIPLVDQDISQHCRIQIYIMGNETIACRLL